MQGHLKVLPAEGTGYTLYPIRTGNRAAPEFVYPSTTAPYKEYVIERSKFGVYFTFKNVVLWITLKKRKPGTLFMIDITIPRL